MLYAIRPLQIHHSVKVPSTAEFDVLGVAVETLTKHHALLTNPVTEPWRWFIWVQWHALAVALAELCSRTEGLAVERAWEVIDVVFQRYAETVADTERGMLWQPIEKLMKKARQNRRSTQMANLSLGEQSRPFSNVVAPVPGPEVQLTPGTNIRPNLSMPDCGTPPTNLASPFAGMPNTVSNKLSPAWNVGILGPGAIEPSPPTTQTTMDGLAPSPDFTTGSLPFNTTALSGAEDNTGFPLDMAWTNWEDFVGEVNLADFDMSNPQVGFPQL